MTSWRAVPAALPTGGGGRRPAPLHLAENVAPHAEASSVRSATTSSESPPVQRTLRM